jgi:hypothetical protein
MSNSTMISTYVIRSDAVDAFRKLLERHWPTLRELGLATETPPLYYLGDTTDEGGVPIVEILEWSSENAAAQAHVHPAVSTIWEQMSELWLENSAHPVRTHLSARPFEVTH